MFVVFCVMAYDLLFSVTQWDSFVVLVSKLLSCVVVPLGRGPAYSGPIR